MLLLIDNYDSFTYNIYQILAEIGADVHVVRNDAMTLPELVALKPERLMISPGPGDPTTAGVSVEAIRHFAGRIPILGVCLGHQSLAHAYGGDVVRAARLMHGKTSEVMHDGRTLFERMPLPFAATRYHSLLVKRDTLPSTFEVSAWTAEAEIMGIRHLPTGAEGVQFHPESILTESGRILLENFGRC
ncbi:MAG TPA: aminodeoxychorismate/anthranilate synthase component II [Myxococcota bacterium]|nr:aminodeoxychorismate/anthranilate synthase component II [Myxococcota bacterium]